MNYKIYNENCLVQLDQMKENCIDSIVTDPPYELNFMGKGWDNAGVSFNKETWQKCLRVLKPGGYLLAFGGSRTFHRIAVAIEDAGFEIRDTIMWLYGSGFPKSMDISKSLDKRNGRTSNEFVEFGKYLKERRGNISQTEISKLFPSKNGGITGRVSNWENGLELPNKEQYAKLKKNLDLDDRYDYLIEKEQAEREVIGKGKAGLTKGTIANFVGNTEFDITIPSTDLAKQWQGWGTALKPSFEPIVVARKPFKGSLVDNVIEWGVGGLNIDECRVGTEKIVSLTKDLSATHGNNWGAGTPTPLTGEKVEHTGRFPANTILTYDQITFDEVCGGFPETKGSKPHARGGTNFGIGIENDNRKNDILSGFNDSGSASRYFYCAKASKKDRDEGLDTLRKNIHPTVKPTELMQYLVRLVTPNGGTVLDPFMGSGSTGKAVAYENQERNKDYKFIGIELNKEYCEIAKARINYAGGKNEEETI